MSKLQIPKGLFDILPFDDKEPWKASFLWQHIEQIARKHAKLFNFKEIRTPIFEKTELFTGTSGETSDIVSKEMYTFLDKADRSMTLRPEGTAPVMRSLIEKQLLQDHKLLKLFYIQPMFRYGRQQAGRYRQHHQFGVECVGDPSAERDAEVIILLLQFYQSLGLKNLKLYLNSVGDTACREAYRRAFLDYLAPMKNQLSQYSLERLDKNPLRILDSKEPEDREAVKNAPSILDFLGEKSRDHFESLKSLLAEAGVTYELDPGLVRGLDYYNRTVFEVVAGELGAQNTLGGGGRYNGLIKRLGGLETPAVGFGTGLERILQTALGQGLHFENIQKKLPILFIGLGSEASSLIAKTLTTLRQNNIPAEGIFHAKKLKTALKESDKIDATYRVIVGQEEVESQEIELTHLVDQQKYKVTIDKLADFLITNLNK